VKVPNFKHHPLAFLGFLVILGLLVLGLLISEVKKAESLLLTEWSRLRYLAYLLETEAPPRPSSFSAEVLKEKLVSQGFKPEAVRGAYDGVEVELELSWRELARLLSWLRTQNFQAKAFYAEDRSGNGDFSVRMVIK